MIKQLLSALALVALLSGCAGKVVKPATAESANSAITAADAARKKAKKVGGEWSNTGKMIKQAKGAAKKKDFAKAVKIANKAREEGELGYEQAASQSELHLPSYLKY
ncbi:MAG: hypothetical protein OEL79_04190 [Chromatiales bacterium]|nr:hypothetical protein [Chromatiales bacterium]